MLTEAQIEIVDDAGHVEDRVHTSSDGDMIRDQPSELERWAAAAAARGVLKVREHLAQLRERGMIDEQGKLLVPFPEDMNPESKTDL